MKKITDLTSLLFLLLFIQNTIAQIGIGTTTPRGALEINSSSGLTAPNVAGLVPPQVALTGTNSVIPVVNPQGGAVVTGTIIYNTASAGSGATAVTPGYYYWDGSNWLKLTSGNNSDWSTTGNAGTSPSTNSIGTTDAADFVTKTNNTEQMRITNAGNVGIGTSTPAYKLDIAGNVNISTPGAPSALSIDAHYSTTNMAQLTFFNSAGAGDFKISSDGGDMFLQGGGSRNLQMGSYHGIDIMGGNLTAGALAFRAGTNSSYNTRIKNLTDAVGLIVQANSSQTKNLQEWRDSSATALSAITPTGSLGLGTNTPAAKLDVAAGTTATNTVVNATGSINDYLQFNVQNTSTGTQAQSGYSATANNGSATTGFTWMGINNSNFNFPMSYNIGVANDVSFLGSGQDMYIANANNSKSIIFSTGKSTSPYFNERMRITNSGNLLIGTPTDNTVDKVQVNGSVSSTQFKVSALNTAPASSTAPGTLGEIRITADYIYICTATNTWVRAALSTW